jgi:hypothetical protein
MSKPFDLQSPETIAKEYGGNKQRIVQAMQMGIVDPTAGVLAGMFIDRMRSAQSQEMAPQSSVAQQVMAPPPPPGAPPAPAGLGATPEAAMLGAPPMGGMGPPMGAPPPGAPPAPPPGGPPPMGDMPPGAPPMGMADGGLAALPISDSMFDEPMDGEYADGGIVAFAGAGEVDYPEQRYGYYRDPRKGMEQFQQLYKPERKYADKASAFYEDVLDPEGMKKRKDESKWFALAELGATMASTPGSLLQAASAGIGAALPGLKEASKELRAETRDAIKQLALSEGESNKQALESAKIGVEGQGKYGEFAEAEAKRVADKKIAELNAATDLEQSRIAAAGSLAAAKEAAAGYGRSFDKQAQQQVFTAVTSTLKEVEDLYAADKQYSVLAREYNFNPDDMSVARKRAFMALEAKKQQDIQKRLSILRSTAPPGSEGAFDRVLKQMGAKEATGSEGGSFQEGQTSRDRQGRPIVYQQGSWVYAD